MHFIKLPTTVYESDTPKPAIGAADTWINLDQVTFVEEHIGSNSFASPVIAGQVPAEYYPCVQFTTADGHTHLVSLGIYSDGQTAFDVLVEFLPSVLQT